jgi:hypothetical protein
METNGFLCLRRGTDEESALMRYDILALEDECSRFLRNVGIGIPRDATSYPELRNHSSLPCLQRPATWPCPETEEHNPWATIKAKDLQNPSIT